MGQRYRIELVRIGDEKDETLVALEGTAELVERLGGVLISNALSDDDALDAPPVGDPVQRAIDDEQGRPKRTRRTKAQIAADRLAAEQAASATTQPGGPVHPQDAVPPAESVPAAVAEPAPTSVPAAPVADVGVPYDPFAAK